MQLKCGEEQCMVEIEADEKRLKHVFISATVLRPSRRFDTDKVRFN